MIEELENTLNNSKEISLDLLETYTGIKSDKIKDALNLDISTQSISADEFRKQASNFVKMVFEKNQ